MKTRKTEHVAKIVKNEIGNTEVEWVSLKAFESLRAGTKLYPQAFFKAQADEIKRLRAALTKEHP